ncbi:hypothetical protein [Phenylobacterium sp.]|uniref:hypothetical protein n=1 Tax=Phenylobacterium sp. TaxID=1871053 RepID=UPI0025E97522|nr:hypothetical protein [Phenylobacterium sp.]MCA6311261.1 hypothetical protein [Phenylobacterium sp.]
MMGEPTWQEIQAEAERRGKLAFETGGRTWTIAEMIVEVMREGWTPPDPRLEAFRAWLDSHRSKGIVGGEVQSAFYAGADWGEKHALELLVANEAQASPSCIPPREPAPATPPVGPEDFVATLRNALRATMPRPHLRPYPREAGKQMVGWRGRYSSQDVFVIPQNSWHRLFSAPRIASQYVDRAGLLVTKAEKNGKIKRMIEISGVRYYLVRTSILHADQPSTPITPSEQFNEWSATRLVLEPGAITLASDFYADFKSWCEEQGIERIMTQTAFGNALAGRQITRYGLTPRGLMLRQGARLASAGKVGTS